MRCDLMEKTNVSSAVMEASTKLICISPVAKVYLIENNNKIQYLHFII